MDPDFWLERWRTGQTRFNQPEPNPALVKYWPEIPAGHGTRVFVPLCGKTCDMLWLRDQHHHVIGNELSDLAVGAFFEENNLKPVLRRAGEFNVYETSGIEIWCGDFFALPAKATAGVTAGYDRASLVAFPPHAQPAYADKLAQLLPEGSDLFLITLDYDQSQMNGPPFSVPDQQVERLFRPAFEIAKREETEILDAEQRYRERGLTRLTSSVHWLHRRPSGKG